jgi:hypothetical protein
MAGASKMIAVLGTYARKNGYMRAAGKFDLVLAALKAHKPEEFAAAFVLAEGVKKGTRKQPFLADLCKRLEISFARKPATPRPKMQPLQAKRAIVYLQSPKGYAVDPRSDAFLETYEWRRIRMVAIKRDGARCGCCGATPADGIKINVDHIKPRRLFPELALDVNNLQVLCHDCNHGKGNWDQTDWRNPAPAFDPAEEFKDRLRIVT